MFLRTTAVAAMAAALLLGACSKSDKAAAPPTEVAAVETVAAETAAPAETVAAATAAIETTAATEVAAATKPAGRFVNVVKLTGIGWFDRMESGVKEFATETGNNATQTGPAEASAEQQVKIITDLIAQKPAAITIVPNSPESVEGIMKQARDQGIVIVTHENSGAKNVDANIEAFDNTAYGSHIMDSLATCMNNKGKYAAFVGSVTAASHNEWAAGALAQAKAKYPEITRVSDPLESKENADIAYQKTKELIQKFPDLAGIEGSASVDIAGIGRAVQELGLQDKICVMGTSIPSVAGKYLADGSVDKMFFWDPALAGKAMLKLAANVIDGKKIVAGMDLGIPGYTALAQSTTNPLSFYGSAWIDVDSKNAGDYPF